MVAWMGFVISWLLWRRRWLSVSRTAVADGSSRMIACSYIFIEKCSIWAIEGILLSMGMAYMVDLAFCFNIGINMLVLLSSTIKVSVSFMSYDFNWTNFFYLMRSFGQEDWFLRSVWSWWSISRLSMSILWFWMSILWFWMAICRCWMCIAWSRLRSGMVWLRFMISWCWSRMIRLRFMISW